VLRTARLSFRKKSSLRESTENTGEEAGGATSHEREQRRDSRASGLVYVREGVLLAG
jgi:hypothetical protein